MIFYAIIAIAVIAVLYMIIADAIDGVFDFGFSAIVLFFAGGCSFVVASLVCLVIGTIAGTHPVYDYSNQLRQVSTGNQVHGSFFLGTGTIHDKQVYTFYRVNSDGSLAMDNVDAKDTVIVEDSSQPRIDTYHGVYPSWDLPGYLSDNNSYVIHVPPNSIAPMVNLNLSGS